MQAGIKQRWETNLKQKEWGNHQSWMVPKEALGLFLP